MISEITLMGERFPALSALERLLAGVNANVRPQIIWTAKLLSTLSALVWFFTGMNPLVLSHF